MGVTIFNYNFRVELLFHLVEPGQVSDLKLPWQNPSLLQSSGSHVSSVLVQPEQTEAITHPHRGGQPSWTQQNIAPFMVQYL